MVLLDVTRSDDRHTSERLAAEPVIWLGTVRRDGRPHNVPVWFAWHDPAVLIFSIPGTVKVRNVRRSPAVSLALDSADGGQDIVLADGRAEFPADADPQLRLLTGTFQEKYARALGACPSSSGVRRSRRPCWCGWSGSRPGRGQPPGSPTGRCPAR